MQIPPPPPLKAPSARVLRNDQRILDAGVAVLAEAGWPGFSLLAVSKRAQLSLRPLQDRFTNRPAMAAALWRHRIGPHLSEGLGDALKAAGLLDEPADAAELKLVAERFLHPSAELQAAAELMTQALFSTQVRGAVEGDVGALVTHWTLPQRGGLSRSHAAQRAFLLALMFGLMLTHRRPGYDDVDLGPSLDALLAALAQPSSPVRLPTARTRHLGEPMDFPELGEVHALLLQSTLLEVGEHGFFDATVSDIVYGAGVSEGFLFARYATKLDLFLDAVSRQIVHATHENERYQKAMRLRHGMGIAEAMIIREFQRPEFERDRGLGFEVHRTAWHNKDLRKMTMRVFEEANLAERPPEIRVGHAKDFAAMLIWEIALGLGVAYLPALNPEVWMLPYDVVTVPFLGNEPPPG
jgi:AcrR family transcriptional regulator